MKVGERLAELRKQNKLTQEQVANYLHITRQAYSRYETGEREISLETLCLLADFYDETTDYILGREDDCAR